MSHAAFAKEKRKKRKRKASLLNEVNKLASANESFFKFH